MKINFSLLLKGLFVSVFVLFATVAFADETITVYTNDGTWECQYTVLSGRDVDKQLSNMSFNMRHGLTDHVWIQKLTIAQEECVRKVLGLYRTKRGDAFRIIMRDMEESYLTRRVVSFLCKFTSDTQYQWWANGNNK